MLKKFWDIWQDPVGSNFIANALWDSLGIRLRRDSWVSVMYAEALNSTTSSVTLQRTDRHGILGQKPWHLQVSL